MSTSGDGSFSALGFLIVLGAVVAGATAVVDVPRELRRARGATVGIWLAVALPSVLGIALPAFYDALYRDPARVRDGQVWRLVTGSVVQDGGAAGAVINLVMLWLVASIAVAVWGPRRAVGLALLGVLGFNATAAYLLDAPGGGNSGATLFLGASVLGLLVLRRRPRELVAALAAVAAGIGLVATKDAHGLPVLAGVLVGAAAGRVGLSPSTRDGAT